MTATLTHEALAELFLPLPSHHQIWLDSTRDAHAAKRAFFAAKIREAVEAERERVATMLDDNGLYLFGARVRAMKDSDAD